MGIGPYRSRRADVVRVPLPWARQSRESRSAFFASYSSGVIAPRSRRSARLARVRVTSSGLAFGASRAAPEPAGTTPCPGQRSLRSRPEPRRPLPPRLALPSRHGSAGSVPSPHAPCRPRTRAWRRASLLEVDRAAQHLHRVDAALGGGQNGQVAVVEQPPEERLIEHRVVDLLERAVGRFAVEDTFDLDHPAVGQRVFLVDVAETGPDRDRDPDDEQGRWCPNRAGS